MKSGIFVRKRKTTFLIPLKVIRCGTPSINELPWMILDQYLTELVHTLHATRRVKPTKAKVWVISRLLSRDTKAHTMKLPLLICILHQTFQIKSQSKSSISFHLKTLGITFDISGIPIVTFQADGSFTRSTYIERKGPFGQEDIFSQLTICLRMTVFYLRGRETYFLSYANPDSADALTGYIERTAFDKTYM